MEKIYEITPENKIRETIIIPEVITPAETKFIDHEPKEIYELLVAENRSKEMDIRRIDDEINSYSNKIANLNEKKNGILLELSEIQKNIDDVTIKCVAIADCLDELEATKMA